ncbi:hypothetical protein CU254_22960 [Amycolatopsis sp. AA4]|uniref:hypothetical protein n=1 Tax=Actinomycetes TaxID=1760 RepID=UPI0001DEE79A|nr:MULTISPECIES: hypothetical protein [Actinomycetes]ATY12984.1 hypothetical protein CU254_22960 [Amycolatopsis sp. AA4]EFL08845.1 predicted protein [Streptomyces sp. AA4]
MGSIQDRARLEAKRAATANGIQTAALWRLSECREFAVMTGRAGIVRTVAFTAHLRYSTNHWGSDGAVRERSIEPDVVIGGSRMVIMTVITSEL